LLGTHSPPFFRVSCILLVEYMCPPIYEVILLSFVSVLSDLSFSFSAHWFCIFIYLILQLPDNPSFLLSILFYPDVLSFYLKNIFEWPEKHTVRGKELSCGVCRFFSFLFQFTVSYFSYYSVLLLLRYLQTPGELSRFVLFFFLHLLLSSEARCW